MRASWTVAAPLPDRVDFNYHIKPLLSDRCFACHKPLDKQDFVFSFDKMKTAK